MACNKISMFAAFLLMTYSHFSLSMDSRQYQEDLRSDSRDGFAYRTLIDISKNAELQHLYITNIYNIEAERYTEINSDTISLLLEIAKNLKIRQGSL